MRYLILALLLILPSLASATWQSDLEATFDIVSTFDELQDWHGGTVGETTYLSGTVQTSATYLPKLLNDDPSPVWKLFSNNRAWDGLEEWIGVRAEGLAFSGTKSLCIAYMDLSYPNDATKDTDGKGPSRLISFFGTGSDPKTGYPDIHVFYMVKFPSGFFTKKLAPNETEYADQPTVKHNEILSGFTAIEYWGTAAEHALITGNHDGAKINYGMNWTVNNFTGGGASTPTNIYLSVTQGVPNEETPGTDAYDYIGTILNTTSVGQDLRGANLATAYESGEWKGFEFRLKRSTSVNGTDGLFSFKIYNSDGTLYAEDEMTGLSTMEDYDHWYNKVGIGGNYNSISAVNPQGITHFYVDDFIVHGSEIAPTYFSMLNGNLGKISVGTAGTPTSSKTTGTQVSITQ